MSQFFVKLLLWRRNIYPRTMAGLSSSSYVYKHLSSTTARCSSRNPKEIRSSCGISKRFMCETTFVPSLSTFLNVFVWHLFFFFCWLFFFFSFFLLLCVLFFLLSLVLVLSPLLSLPPLIYFVFLCPPSSLFPFFSLFSP